MVRRSSTPPVSSPTSTRMRHTPVSVSPASSARSTGAAPRQRGSNEKCRLTMGTRANTCGLISAPYATTTPRSHGASSTSSTACDTVSPRSSAACFTGLGESSLPRPRRLSARVITCATSTPASTRARSGGTAMAGVPRKTTRRIGPLGSGARSVIGPAGGAAAWRRCRRRECACTRPVLPCAVRAACDRT